MKHKKIAVAGMTAAMLVGAGAGLALNIPGSAGASSSTITATTPDDDTTTTDDATTDTTTTATDDNGNGAGPGRGGGFSETLAELVTAGTITQEQADALAAAFEANRPLGGEGGRGGGHRGPGGGHGRGQSLEVAATALGITADELRTELQAGKTIATVSTEKGVDLQTVIDAIVADQTANIVERVTNMVNGIKPAAPDAPAADDTADDVTTTTTG